MSDFMDADTAYKMVALKQAYKNMVKHRLGRLRPLSIPDKMLRPIALRLESVYLAKLFVEGQFHCMPREWCTSNFKQCFPPPSAVFSGRCWERYEEYTNRGIRDAT